MFKKILTISILIISASSFAATNQSDQNTKPIKNIDNRQVLYHISEDPNYHLTENILNVDPTYPVNLSLRNKESQVYRVLQDTIRNYWFSQQYQVLLELNHNMLKQKKLSQVNNSEHELKNSVLNKIEAKYKRLKLALNSNPSIKNTKKYLEFRDRLKKLL